MDFFTVRRKAGKNNSITIFPDFSSYNFKDLMIRGHDFYAIWDPELGLWSRDQDDVGRIVDNELTKSYDQACTQFDENNIHVQYMRSYSSNSWQKYRKWIKDCSDNYIPLDTKLTFANQEVKRDDYASKKLPYSLSDDGCPNYTKLMTTLYDDDNRRKLEWGIGSILTGDSKDIQKFFVLYGEAGSGKSTVLNIIQKLLPGYYTVFNAKQLGLSNNQFATAAFRNDSLVAIQHDGDLSKIEDNSLLNSIISHEQIEINEKFKAGYVTRINAMLFMGTNRPVKITDSKSGLIRRLIDVTPSGERLSAEEYQQVYSQIDFELGSIASRCIYVYRKCGKHYYDAYKPMAMMYKTDIFYNFVESAYPVFDKQDSTTLKQAWELYKSYISDSGLSYTASMMNVREELKDYFRMYEERHFDSEEQKYTRKYYSGFKREKFFNATAVVSRGVVIPGWLNLSDDIPSNFDKLEANCYAQYAKSDKSPKCSWDYVTTKLAQIDTSQLHYVRVPENHIVLDFDIKNDGGQKDPKLNLEAASKWPKTYAELSQGGAGLHLHYIYDGDPEQLASLAGENVEIKVFKGKSALRRRLSKCNDLPIAHISSGLPLKGVDKKMINFTTVKSERALRELIERNLRKEIHPGTKPSMDFIKKILDDAYESGLKYDVTDLRPRIMAFANNSTHQADYCISLIPLMKFKSEEASDPGVATDDSLWFFDTEVFSNLFVISVKKQGSDTLHSFVNPTPDQIERLFNYNLVGFNCRKYDNHIMYAATLGYSNQKLYELSQKIVSHDSRNAMFGEAYNISYTDVYDFAAKKQSLKKWEIELGINHDEFELPWDEPVPENMWPRVCEYCENDVRATEAVFNHLKADFAAREMQVALVKALHPGMQASVNDTTNTLSTRIIFGTNKNPQRDFNYRNLADPVPASMYEFYKARFGDDYEFHIFDVDGMPTYKIFKEGMTLEPGQSILPFFPGYVYKNGKSTYLGEEIGEGGRVYGEPGMYKNVWDGDVASMHPHSVIFESLFGPNYTQRFKDIVDARVAIKHRDFKTAGTMLGGALKPYLNEDQAADLAQALKIVINSVYGLTTAAFTNPFKDIRNKDNIVAKRGALFMTLLKKAVNEQGYDVCHIKTDSIKIPNADQKIQDFVIKFGQEFGYTFETEADFDRYCLVNNAVYIGHLASGKHKGEWEAIGAQFAVPYVFKTLFSKEKIIFDDYCETKSVQSKLYLDMNDTLPDVSAYEKELESRIKNAKPDATRQIKLNPEFQSYSDDDLRAKIAEGHDYKFIGRIGRFVPVKKGCGGGTLLRHQNDKFYSVTGCKGYCWMLSEYARSMVEKGEDIIDTSYHMGLVDEAIETISQYGDFDSFVAD